MPREYQITKNNPYYIPNDLYMQVKYKIKGYDRLKKDYLDTLYSSPPPPNGMPRSNAISNPTEQRAIKLAYLEDELRAVDQSIIELRGKYSGKTDEFFDVLKAYWSYDYYNYAHIRTNKDDDGPSRRTWNYFKSLLSYLIAKKLNLF